MFIVRLLLKPTQSCVVFFRLFLALKAAFLPTFSRWGLNQPPTPAPGVRQVVFVVFWCLQLRVKRWSTLWSMVNPFWDHRASINVGWWRLVGGFVDVGTLWLVIESWSLLLVVWMDFVYFFGVNCCFLFWFCFFWNLSHIVGHEFLCVFFWSMPAPQKHLNAQL